MHAITWPYIMIYETYMFVVNNGCLGGSEQRVSRWMVNQYVCLQDMASCNNMGDLGNKDSTSNNCKTTIFYALPCPTPNCASNIISTYTKDHTSTLKACICNNDNCNMGDYDNSHPQFHTRTTQPIIAECAGSKHVPLCRPNLQMLVVESTRQQVVGQHLDQTIHLLQGLRP